MNLKTVLIVAMIAACCGNVFAQEQVAQRSTAQKVPGVNAPLIPFEEKDKIKYEDAVERAKKNDPEAYYWLAYYFLKGEGVEENREAAGKFLQKAVDAGNPQACYLVGLRRAREEKVNLRKRQENTTR